MVRDDLEAKLTRSVYYQTADLVVSEQIDNTDWLGIWSSGQLPNPKTCLD
jgi:hypothetical protein